MLEKFLKDLEYIVNIDSGSIFLNGVRSAVSEAAKRVVDLGKIVNKCIGTYRYNVEVKTESGRSLVLWKRKRK